MNEPPKPAPLTPADQLAIQSGLLKKIEGHLSFIRSVLTVFIVLSIVAVVIQACQVILATIASP